MANRIRGGDAAIEPTDADGCFALGMIYSAGAGVAVDLIEAHKWFNIAAMRGHADAARLRREIAEQMADAEIGRAQRAARDWLKSHPQAPAPSAAPFAPRLDAGSCAAIKRASSARSVRDHARPIGERRLTEQPRLRVPGAALAGQRPAPVRRKRQHHPDRTSEAPARCATAVSTAMVRSASAATAAVSAMSARSSPRWRDVGHGAPAARHRARAVRAGC